jgi:hypothetical protein
VECGRLRRRLGDAEAAGESRAAEATRAAEAATAARAEVRDQARRALESELREAQLGERESRRMEEACR